MYGLDQAYRVSLSKLGCSPSEVEIIVNFIIYGLWDVDWWVLGIKLEIKFFLVELFELVLSLLDWVAILILIFLTLNMLLCVLLLDCVPSLSKFKLVYKRYNN